MLQKRPKFVTEKRKRKQFSRVVDVEEIYLLYSMTLMCVAPTGLVGSGAGDINNQHDDGQLTINPSPV